MSTQAERERAQERVERRRRHRSERLTRVHRKYKLENCLLFEPPSESYAAFRQISLGDYVYVDAPEESAPAGATNMTSASGAAGALGATGGMQDADAHDARQKVRLVTPSRAQCTIVRVERIWKDASYVGLVLAFILLSFFFLILSHPFSTIFCLRFSSGAPFIFGNYILRPTELPFPDKTRKYFPNEVHDIRFSFFATRSKLYLCQACLILLTETQFEIPHVFRFSG